MNKQYRELECLRADVARMNLELKSRDEFLAAAAHELKTPVAATKLKLQTGLRILRQSAKGEVSQETLLELFRDGDHQMSRLTRLIDNLLDLSRANSGKLLLQLESCDLGELIAEVCDRYSRQITHAKSFLKIEVEAGLVGRWDRDRLDQVLSNLLTNAVRHAPGSTISVGAQRLDATVQIVVKDEGPGISLVRQERIFERCEHPSFQSGDRGMGLGLYITREIVLAHQGSIWVKSQAWSGAAFHVSLPLSLHL